MVLMDIIPEKAKAHAIDCMDTISFLPHKAIIRDGGIQELSKMDIIVISVGSLTKNEQRLEELKGSLEAIKSFVPDFKSCVVSPKNSIKNIKHISR